MFIELVIITSVQPYGYSMGSDLLGTNTSSKTVVTGDAAVVIRILYKESIPVAKSSELTLSPLLLLLKKFIEVP